MNRISSAGLWLAALLACLAPAPAAAQAPTGLGIVAPAGTVPAQAMVFDDGTGHAQTITVAHGLPSVLTCTVVSGDQALTVGSSAGCTMTSTGRLKVGLSSAATIGTTASSIADLAGFKDPSGNQAAGNVDGSGNLKVSIVSGGGSGSAGTPYQQGPGAAGAAALNVYLGGQYQTLLSTEQALGYATSGKTPVSTSLTAAGVSATFTPIAGRDFHMMLVAGTGSASCYIERQGDGTHWFYATVAGQAIGPVTYTGAPVDETVNEEAVGVSYRWDCGGLYGSYASGTIVAEIGQ